MEILRGGILDYASSRRAYMGRLCMSQRAYRRMDRHEHWYWYVCIGIAGAGLRLELEVGWVEWELRAGCWVLGGMVCGMEMMVNQSRSVDEAGRQSDQQPPRGDGDARGAILDIT